MSGARLWGFAKDRFVTPQRFFRDFFVANYCPLSFMEESGKNRTPDKLPVGERDALFAACDAALAELVDAVEPELVIGVGAFAEKRARSALSARDVRIASILHPSPASPRANQGWASAVARELDALGVEVPNARR